MNPKLKEALGHIKEAAVAEGDQMNVALGRALLSLGARLYRLGSENVPVPLESVDDVACQGGPGTRLRYTEIGDLVISTIFVGIGTARLFETAFLAKDKPILLARSETYVDAVKLHDAAILAATVGGALPTDFREDL